MSPFLQGAFAPVDEETTTGPLAVRGRLPEALDGLFTRIGPNPLRPPRRSNAQDYQWFRQPGMVAGVRLRGGRAEWLRSRWVRSTAVTRGLGEPRTPGPRHFPWDTVNTNVVATGAGILAVIETGCSPVRLDGELRTVAYTDLGGSLPRGIAAHPKLDSCSGELHAVVYSPLRRWAEYTVIDRAGQARSIRRIDVPGRPLLHDIAVTESFVVLFDLPVRFDFAAAARGRFPYTWHERARARLGVLPRLGDGPTRWFDIAACFLFHTVTASENAAGTVVTVRAVRYRRLFDSGNADPLSQGGCLWQWTVDLATGRVSEQQLDDRLQELPRVNPDALCRGARYSYAVTAGSDRGSSHVPDALIKNDARTGTAVIRPAPRGNVPSEAVFIARDPAAPPIPTAAEDDGWILYFSYDGRCDRSSLIVADAQDFAGEPVAQIDLPVRIPFGFHSTWVPAAALAAP